MIHDVHIKFFITHQAEAQAIMTLQACLSLKKVKEVGHIRAKFLPNLEKDRQKKEIISLKFFSRNSPRKSPLCEII
jgi:hypothetical protein